MKPLKPSHKERKRYLLVKGKDVSKDNIEKIILEFIGVLGYAEAGIIFVKINKASVIIAINREAVDKIRTSFLMSKKDLNIVKISGSVKNVK
jgi:RNase P/RNase MRP subunit POP5